MAGHQHIRKDAAEEISKLGMFGLFAFQKYLNVKRCNKLMRQVEATGSSQQPSSLRIDEVSRSEPP
jgi:hypothetical protein